MKVELENVKPMDIEKRSFEIITEELGDTPLLPGTELVVKRCIHTSADFDYAKNLCFSENAVEKAIQAIKDGACIVTDTIIKLQNDEPLLARRSLRSGPHLYASWYVPGTAEEQIQPVRMGSAHGSHQYHGQKG